MAISEHLQPGIDRKKLYYILDGFILKKSFTQKAVHYVYHVGGPKPSMHFAWKIPNDETETDLKNRNLNLISEIRKQIPTFERRITKKEFKNAFSFAAPSHTLRTIFKQLTGDKSAATNVTEAKIDRRLEFALLSGDESIIVDLR